MIKGGKEYLDQIVTTHVCPEHGPKLVVAWHAGEDSYVIRCGEGHFPEEVTRQMTPVEEHKAGEREAHQPITTLLPRVDLATGELLTPVVIEGLKAYAERYGLDPYRGHVCLMYGKPYIGLDGYLYHANKEEIPYSLTGRPMTEDELKARGYQPDDLGYLARVKRLDTGAEFEGVGFITKDEIEEEAKGRPGIKR